MPFPLLAVPGDYARLGKHLDPALPVIGLWATGAPRQTVDILLHFRAMLRERGRQVIFLSRESGLPLCARLCAPGDRELIYQCDDVSLLAACSFIDVLFTHDYIIGPPRRFAAKLVLFQHNFGMLPSALGTYYADYALSRTKDVPTLDFTCFPNSVKRAHSSNLTVIPAGYPKLDLLLALRKRRGAGLHRRVSYFPIAEFILHAQRHYSHTVMHQERLLVEMFLNAFPGWEFLVHPYWGDRDSLRFLALRERFSSCPGFCYDLSEDNSENLMASDLLLTDYSNIDRNFAYATLRPVIRFHPAGSAAPSFREAFLGYEAFTAEQALAAIGEALASLPAWKERIFREREREVRHPGASLEYLCDHLDNILRDRPAPDWIVLDKGNTPYDRVADYLKLFKRPPVPLAHHPTPLDWAIARHGLNPRIGLAVLRACLRAWKRQDEVGRLAVLQEQIETCLSMAPPQQLLGLLRHMAAKDPSCAVHKRWLAEALTRFSPESPELFPLLSALRGLSPDPVLADGISRLLLRHGEREAALAVLRRVIPGHQAPLTVYVRFVCLLLAAGATDEARKHLNGARHFFVSSGEFSPQFSFCERLIQARLEDLPFPEVRDDPGNRTFSLYGVTLRFQTEAQADAVLGPVIKLFRRHAGRNGSWWYDCSKLYAVCGREEEALVAARQAVVLAPGTIFLLTHLTDMLARSGRFEEAVRVAEEAAGRWPDNAELLDTLALLQECAGNIPAALDAARRALELDPQQPKRLLRLKELRGRLVRSTRRGR